MNLINKHELQRLMEKCERPCVSIYMPAHRAGREVQGDSIRLKNLLNKAEEQLIAAGIRAPEALDMLEPTRQILTDTIFWQNQSDGLALFISGEFMRYYRVPLAFETLAITGGRFHLKPLLSLLTGDGRFFILALSQNEVRLLQGTHYSVDEIHLEHIPGGLEEALRWDDPERQTQYHTSSVTPQGESIRRATAQGRPAIFHGHGVESATEHKEQVLRYFHKIAAGVHEILAGEHAPLVLAAVDYLRPIYEQANTYPHLVEDGVPGNPEELSAQELHAQAWNIVRPIFDRVEERAVEEYHQLAGAGSDQASAVLQEVIPAAYAGRVKTLFVARGTQTWGVFDLDAQRVAVSDAAEPDNEDLLDLAAEYTLLHGGTVYAKEPDQMPAASPLIAVYRY